MEHPPGGLSVPEDDQEMGEEQLQFSWTGDHVGESVLIKHMEDSLVEGNHLQQS